MAQIPLNPLPRPDARYNLQDQTQTRAQIEQALRAIIGALVGPLSITIIGDASGNSQVTPVPAAKTEWDGSLRWRTQVDLRDYQSVELVTYVMSAGSANAEMRFEYTADLTGATGWAYLDGTSGPGVSLAATGPKTKQVLLTPGARGTVLIRPVSIKGDGVTAAAVGLTRVVFR